MSGGRIVGAALAAVPAAWLTYVFYWRYWAFRGCIREALSSCQAVYPNGDVVPLTDGGMMWGVLALPFWGLALWLLLSGLRPGARRWR